MRPALRWGDEPSTTRGAAATGSICLEQSVPALSLLAWPLLEQEEMLALLVVLAMPVDNNLARRELPGSRYAVRSLAEYTAWQGHGRVRVAASRYGHAVHIGHALLAVPATDKLRWSHRLPRPLPARS